MASANKQFNNAFQIPSANAKALMNVLNSIKDYDVKVKVINSDDGKPFGIIAFTEGSEKDGEGRTSVYMSICDKSGPHLKGIQRFHGFDYKNYQVTLRTNMLMSCIKSAISVDKASATYRMDFIKNTDDDTVECVISATNTGSSTDNTYKMTCDGFNAGAEDAPSDGKLFSLNVPIEILSSIVSKNKNPFTGFDVQSGETDKSYVRIGFLDLDAAAQAKAAYMAEHEVEVMSVMDKMEIRNDYINTCYYMTMENAK